MIVKHCAPTIFSSLKGACITGKKEYFSKACIAPPLVTKIL